MNLQGRNLLKETDLSAAEFLYLVDLSGRVRLQKRMGLRTNRLAGSCTSGCRRVVVLAVTAFRCCGSLDDQARNDSSVPNETRMASARRSTW